MLLDPNLLTLENIADIDLFPRRILNATFPPNNEGGGIDFNHLFWQAYIEERNYVFAENKFLGLLKSMHNLGLFHGLQLDVGCGVSPVTNEVLPPSHRFEETYWVNKQKILKSISLPYEESSFQRMLTDYHPLVHQLGDLQDNPVTCQLDLRLFYSEVTSELTSNRGYILRPKRDTSQLVALNEKSFEIAWAKSCQNIGLDTGSYFSSLVASCIFNYIPWKAFSERIHEYMAPGALYIIHNIPNGSFSHIDFLNTPNDQNEITAFFRQRLGCKIILNVIDGSEEYNQQLYLIAQKQ